MATTNKWSKGFWVDLGERVAATFVGALIGLLTLSGTTAVEWTNPTYLWTVLGLPVAFSVLKGLAANLKDSESGASLVDAPPGPVVVNEGGYAVLGALGLGLIILSVLLLVTTLLKVFVVSFVVLIVLFVVGLVLLFLDGRRTGSGIV
jgi:ABC-type amino acid transport system permease subunit